MGVHAFLAFLQAFAERHGMTPAQAAIAWLAAQEDVIAIPKTSTPERQAENQAAADLTLTAEQRAELEQLFPAPAKQGPLPIV